MPSFHLKTFINLVQQRNTAASRYPVGPVRPSTVNNLLRPGAQRSSPNSNLTPVPNETSTSVVTQTTHPASTNVAQTNPPARPSTVTQTTRPASTNVVQTNPPARPSAVTETVEATPPRSRRNPGSAARNPPARLRQLPAQNELLASPSTRPISRQSIRVVAQTAVLRAARTAAAPRVRVIPDRGVPGPSNADPPVAVPAVISQSAGAASTDTQQADMTPRPRSKKRRVAGPVVNEDVENAVNNGAHLSFQDYN